ncbi:MAG: dihydrouridine synthase, partial [Fibrobacteraceae bacterium]|nr:dihydrouridine synthase [Fibrobacteraceae bacterium]
EALDVFPVYYRFLQEEGRTELGAMGRLKQLAARLCKGFCLDDKCERREGGEAAMEVRQQLLTSESPEIFFERLESLKEGVAKSLRYEPSRLVNLNGAKDNSITYGDHYK